MAVEVKVTVRSRFVFAVSDPPHRMLPPYR